MAFDHHQVGTRYANGIQVSDDQIIKPLGDRLLTKLGKIMGSTVSPNGQFLAATSTDKSVALQIFDLKTYKLIWTVGTAAGLSQGLSDGTVGQEGPTYSPDGKFLWLPEQDAITRFPVNDQGTWGPRPVFRSRRRAATFRVTTRPRRPTPRWWARSPTRPTGPRCTPR